MLKEKTLFESIDKVKTAIKALKEFEPEEGYYVAFSGGKDSVVIQRLVEKAGVKHDTHYNVTTIDPPDLVYFIRKEYPNVIFDRPETPFLVRMVKKGFPLRQSRWCCEEYKENGGAGRFVITGVRRAESHKRAGRRMIETCRKGKGKRFLNVIVHWTEEEVWEFIKKYKVPYCKLYDEGWKRIGCLFCPMAVVSHKKIEMAKYPRYEQAYRRAFRNLYNDRKANGNPAVNRWKDGDEMFDWWIDGSGSVKENPDQGVLFE